MPAVRVSGRRGEGDDIISVLLTLLHGIVGVLRILGGRKVLVAHNYALYTLTRGPSTPP